MINKVLFFDIESTNLSANFGTILCISYKWNFEKEVHTISITDFPEFQKDPTNDKQVVKEFKKVYEEADFTVAHFGARFDIPMINTKLIMHHLSPLPNTRLIDTWWIAKHKLKLNSNRLETLIAALGLKHKKTPLSGPIWIRATAGHRASIEYITTHCESDVKALEEAYNKLIVLMGETMPKTHTCDKKYLRSQGYRVCNSSTYKRLYCVKCGSWLKGSVVK